MWIRSQDERLLLDCSGFRFARDAEQPMIWGLWLHKETPIGRYKSEFEANAVLDMLAQRTIDPWELDEYTNSAVFQMPPKGFIEGEG